MKKHEISDRYVDLNQARGAESERLQRGEVGGEGGDLKGISMVYIAVFLTAGGLE